MLFEGVGLDEIFLQWQHNGNWMTVLFSFDGEVSY